MNFTATLFNPQQADIILTKLWPQVKDQLTAGKRIDLIVKQEKRSNQQNRRYWGRGVLAQIAEQAVVNGKMYAPEVWHEFFKKTFIGLVELPDGSVIGKSSTELTKGEFSDFCLQVEEYAIRELGVTFYDLPSE